MFLKKYEVIYFNNNICSENKECLLNINKFVKELPVPLDFNGEEILLLNNSINKKNKLVQELTLINLESRNSIVFSENISNIYQASIVLNGFAVIQNQTNVFLFSKKKEFIQSQNNFKSNCLFKEDRALQIINSESDSSQINNKESILIIFRTNV